MGYQAVSRMTGTTTNPQFCLIDKNRLITTERSGVDPSAAPFAKAIGEVESIGLREGSDLLEAVKKVKPHVLLGLSGVGGIFNKQVLKAMRDSDSTKPAIFTISNPTDNAEYTATDAFKHAGENIVFGSESPFQNVDLAMDGESGMFTIQHTVGTVLCCKCGILIAPNAANMCVKCLRSEVDMTGGLQKHVIIIHCPECDRYLQPPRT